jgi:hypothetical protein
MRAVGSALVYIALATPLALAQDPAAVSGYVADDGSSALIPGATVTLVTTGEETQSGPDGSFSFSDAPVGPISVRVSAPGYQGLLWEAEVVPGRVLFLEVLLTKLEGDATLRLRVTHEDSDEPIAGVDVGFPELGISAETDQDGEVEITDLPTGNWLVLVTGLGYNSAQSFIEFGEGAVTEGDVALTEGPIFLPGLTITAEMRSRSLDDAGFYDRERRGFGYHFDPEDIEASVALVPSDLLRTVPGLNQPNQRMTGPRDPITGQVVQNTLPQCLWVEGIPWAGGNIDDLPIGWIEGMEVYTRVASLPMQFDRAAEGCLSALVIWLK